MLDQYRSKKKNPDDKISRVLIEGAFREYEKDSKFGEIPQGSLEEALKIADKYQLIFIGLPTMVACGKTERAKKLQVFLVIDYRSRERHSGPLEPVGEGVTHEGIYLQARRSFPKAGAINCCPNPSRVWVKGDPLTFLGFIQEITPNSQNRS